MKTFFLILSALVAKTCSTTNTGDTIEITKKILSNTEAKEVVVKSASANKSKFAVFATKQKD